MAIVTTAKYTGGSGTTHGNRVVLNISGANHTLGASDFTFSGKVVNINKIETVMNCGASAVTIDGKVYETGRWELSQIGGLPLAAANTCAVTFTTVGTGNVFIEFRS